MRINYNISSIIARNALNNNDTRLSESIQRLSSGLKINSAADDAAGLAVSRKMNAQLRSLEQSNQNANDGVSVVNTADGAMAEMHSILQRMNELSVQSANGTNASSDRELIQLEINELVEELDRIAETTEFNAQNLLDGTFAYKGFTNSENIKVMSYEDGVTNGVYAIEQIEYTYSESTTIFADNDKETKTKINYEVTNLDALVDALVTEEDLIAYGANDGKYRAFPDGAKVKTEENRIIITAENDFEVKLVMNEREPVAIAGTTVTTAVDEPTDPEIVKEYKGIEVADASGNKYSIESLKYNSTDDEYYTGKDDLKYADLKSDLLGFLANEYPGVAIDKIEITDFTYDNATNSFSLTVDADGTTATHTLSMYQQGVTTTTLEDNLYSTTTSYKKTYTIGGGGLNDCIKLDMTGMGPMRLQVGANEGQVIAVEIPQLKAENFGIKNLDITTQETAVESIDKIGKAINQLSAVRSKIGAYTNRLEHTITNLNTTEENLTAAYSRVMDVDMAKEMTEYSTVQILVQSSTSMLSQANERPQQVLQLLQ